MLIVSVNVASSRGKIQIMCFSSKSWRNTKEVIYFMKKIIYLLTITISIGIFSILFIEKNKEDVVKLTSVSSGYPEKVTDRKGCEINVTLTDRDKNKIFLDKLLELAKDNDYIVVTNQVIHLDGNVEKYIFYIYDQKDMIKNDLLEYFGNGNEVEKNTLSTQTCLSLINNHFLDKEIFEYKNFDDFINEVYTVNDVLSYNVYSNDKELVDKQVHEIAEGLIEIETEDSWGYNESNMNPIVILFMIIAIIFLVISIITFFLNNKKEFSIAELLGYNSFDILKKYLFVFIGKLTLLFVVCQVIIGILFVDNITGNTIQFIKDMIIKDVIFLFILCLCCIIVFLAIIRKTNLKKSVNFQPLLNLVYCFKITYIFLFCYIFTFSFYQNDIILKQTFGLLKYYELCEDYYSINNIVGDSRGDKVIDIFLKEKNTIACICYSEENEEIPFLIANKNYVELFNDDIQLKNNMLIVPNQYKDINLYRYKLDENIDIQYIDGSYTYDGLAIYPGQSFQNPIIYVINHDYYSSMHLLLSKDKTIEEYQQMASLYIESYELRLENANRFIEEMFVYLTLPALIEIVCYFILFIFSFIMIIYIFMKIYFEQYNKEIAVKNTLGYRFMEIYYPIYAMHIMAYILPMILVGFMLKDIQVLLIFFVMTFSFDFIVQTILLKMNHRKSKLMLLKDGE